uniref:RNase III domain-containing protein n=1 Tax=Leucosporidium scottii TaxID=5278 RepID=A0A0H5FTS7_9BASI|nr:hypothetical protein [Leucosporidium scottii]
MLLRGPLHSARLSTSHARLSTTLPKPSPSQALHSSTANPANKKAANLRPSQTEQRPLAERKRWQELVKEHRKLRAPRCFSQSLTSTKSEWPYLDKVAAALFLPMPTELPPLPPALEKEVFRIKADASPATPHYEVLEWLGDRELNSVAAQVVVVLAPEGFGSQRLKWHSQGWVRASEEQGSKLTSCLLHRLSKLITGKAAAVFAKQFGMNLRFKTPVSEETLADRFESYVGALWACKGSGAVLELLAPIFGREMLKVALDELEVQEVAEGNENLTPVPAPAVRTHNIAPLSNKLHRGKGATSAQ